MQVVGVWFYEEAEARKVAALLHHISSQHKEATTEAAVTLVVRRQYAQTFGLNCPVLAHFIL